MSVTVVIPSFNRASLLQEAVESALAQTYAPLNVIISDDGSREAETVAILNSLEDRDRVTVLRQENKGAASAMNAGIRASTSEYILVLGDDDRVAPTYAEKAVARLSANETLGVVYCLARKFGVVNSPWVLPDFSPAQMALGNCVFASGFFRREDWELVGGFRESLRNFEDWDFWIRLIMLGRSFDRIPEELFFYRVGHASKLGPTRGADARARSSYDQIFQNNIQFFAQHVKVINDERLRLDREVRRWRADYSAIDRSIGPLLRRARLGARRLLSSSPRP